MQKEKFLMTKMTEYDTGNMVMKINLVYFCKIMRQSDYINQYSRWSTSSFAHKYFKLTGFRAFLRYLPHSFKVPL